eukprot:3918719-Pleurochrysis_carterae.AAC.1
MIALVGTQGTHGRDGCSSRWLTTGCGGSGAWSGAAGTCCRPSGRRGSGERWKSECGSGRR